MIQSAYRTVPPREARPPMQVTHPEHGLFVVEQVSIVAGGIEVMGPKLGRAGKVRATISDDDVLRVVADFDQLLAIEGVILDQLGNGGDSAAITSDGDRLAVIVDDNMWYVDLLSEADRPKPPEAKPRKQRAKKDAAAKPKTEGTDGEE